MSIHLRRLWAGLCLAALPVYAEPAPPPVAPIPATEFRGWTNAFRLQNDRAEAVFVPAVGRLVHFARLDGASPLRLEPALAGKTPAAGETFFNLGGDWFWPVSQARWPALSADGRDWPPPAALGDETPWTGTAWTDADGAPCVQFVRRYGAPLNVEATRLFRLEPTSAVLVVRQRLERTEPSAIPVVLWNVSQIAQAEHVVLPTDEDSKFRGGLKALMGRLPPRQQLARCGAAAVYRVAPGAETKLGSDSPRGWIAAARGADVVFEAVANTAAGDYPDGGCVVEVYSNQGLGYSEIETLSPELPLEPGTVLENVLRIQLATTEPPLAACPLADALRTLFPDRW